MQQAVNFEIKFHFKLNKPKLLTFIDWQLAEANQLNQHLIKLQSWCQRIQVSPGHCRPPQQSSVATANADWLFVGSHAHVHALAPALVTRINETKFGQLVNFVSFADYRRKPQLAVVKLERRRRRYPYPVPPSCKLLQIREFLNSNKFANTQRELVSLWLPSAIVLLLRLGGSEPSSSCPPLACRSST